MYKNYKRKAIFLRKQGFSYSEILKEIPVARSTLSLWLRKVGLSKTQEQKFTEKKRLAMLRGAEARRSQRITATERIKSEAIKEVKLLSKRELWLIGISLYWAEGSKEKESHPGLGVNFTNSDPFMIKIFLKWLTEICEIKKENVCFEIYIHEYKKPEIEKVIKYWCEVTGFSKEYFKNVYYKTNKINSARKNQGSLYYGLVRVKVRASSSLNRKIAGWIAGINSNYWGIV